MSKNNGFISTTGAKRKYMWDTLQMMALWDILHRIIKKLPSIEPDAFSSPTAIINIVINFLKNDKVEIEDLIGDLFTQVNLRVKDGSTETPVQDMVVLAPHLDEVFEVVAMLLTEELSPFLSGVLQIAA